LRALKSGIVPRSLVLLLPLVCAGCARSPETYPPPEQRKSLAASPALGYFAEMSAPDADNYLVKDVAGPGGGSWRWAYSHPVLRFYVPPAPRLHFAMDFSLPERTFRETGPVTLTIRINGELLDRHRCETAGQQHYSHPVPPEIVRVNQQNLVAIDPDPVWVSKADGGRLGFILVRAGFVE
jgi:hypothetical protein